MKLNDFYDIVDAELETIINDYNSDKLLKKYKQVNQKKGYALLIWFLKFYGQTLSIKEYITDGNGDSSCDIIFDRRDSFGKKVFYIVQSKWNNKKNCENSFKSMEFKQTLNDFETILRGDKQETENDRFNKKYRELIEHLQKNGRVKFIFLSLCPYNDKCNDNINSFRKNYMPYCELDIIDIDKLRKDYIEFKYKNISTDNPLEYKYDAEFCNISLPIERFGVKSERDFIDYYGPSKAYIFIIKPYTIFKLFEKFKYSLFYKNVRNPLLNSNHNKAIVETLKERPGDFWYFNNGITAITKFVPDVGIKAEQIDIKGLQVINGAQTVHSIYLAYKNADELQRQVMDADARITLRLIRSSNEKFNLEITRYTNSQNEVTDVDFMSNDEVQIRLQNESFNTNIWYMKRRGEFLRDNIPKEIKIIPNHGFVDPYVAFFKQNPLSVIKDRKRFFISFIDDNKGLYESIFNDNTKYDDMLASYYIYSTLLDEFAEKNDEEPNKIKITNIKYNCMLHIFALSKVVLEMYLKNKNDKTDKDVNISLYIRNAYEKKQENNLKIIKNIFDKATDLIFKDEENFEKMVAKIMDSPTYYNMIVENLKDEKLNEEDIIYIETNNEQESQDEVAATEERNESI